MKKSIALRIAIVAFTLAALFAIGSTSSFAQCNGAVCPNVSLTVDPALGACCVPLSLYCNDGFVTPPVNYCPGSYVFACGCATHGGMKGVRVGGTIILVGQTLNAPVNGCCYKVGVFQDQNGCIVLRVTRC